MKRFLLALAMISSLMFASPALASAQAAAPATNPAKESVCAGVGLTGTSCDNTSGPGVDSTVRLVINTLSWIVGLIAVIMIIIGGLKYITSAGDSNSVNSAKNTILYAVIGLVVVLMAQILVKFVVSRVG